MSRQPDEYRDLYEQMRQLTDRVDQLEESISAVDSTAADETTVTALKDDVRELETTLTQTITRLDEMERQLDELNGVDEEVDGLKRLVADTKGSLTDKLRETNKRIATIEDSMDENPAPKASGGVEIPDNASEIAYLAALPEHVRSEHIDNKAKQRAVETYNNFDRWSEYTPKGYIIKSGDLKRLLSDDVSWSQVYRVMEAFAKNTDADYAYIEKDSTGKALIRFVE